MESRREAISAAIDGDLNRLKELVVEYDDGRGLADTVMSFNNENGRGAIHYAAAKGKLNVLDYLIEELGIDVNFKDERGQSPLIHAIYGGNMKTVEYLLGKGADPKTSNTNGYTPLHCAAENGYPEILTLLLSRGVDVNACSKHGTPRGMAPGEGQLDSTENDSTENPFFFSSLLFTPLAGSILNCLRSTPSLRCIELLLEAGADPEGGSHENNALVAAAFRGFTEIIKRLIQAGANPDVTNFYGLTPLEIAALNGYRDAAEILFPVTSRIPEYIDWSVDGVIGHVQSDQAHEERKLKYKEKFDNAKLCGADAFKKQDYVKATVWYTQANEIDPRDANVLSNRSMCCARMKEGVRALKDAIRCISLRPDWPKAYYRAGVACSVLKRYDGAQQAFLEGLKLSPNSQDLKDAYREAQAQAQAQLNNL